jgi:hypothetical protein
MFSRTITCPSCGSENDFIIQGALPAMHIIRCSYCPALLGRWGDLAQVETIPAPASRSPDEVIEDARGTGAR